jgi:hypothetical protein
MIFIYVKTNNNGKFKFQIDLRYECGWLKNNVHAKSIHINLIEHEYLAPWVLPQDGANIEINLNSKKGF